VSVNVLLTSHGVTNLTGWTLPNAVSVSADGRTIVGYGTNPSGQLEAWIATVPEPSSLALATCAGIGLAFALTRRHRSSR